MRGIFRLVADVLRSQEELSCCLVSQSNVQVEISVFVMRRLYSDCTFLVFLIKGSTNPHQRCWESNPLTSTIH